MRSTLLILSLLLASVSAKASWLDESKLFVSIDDQESITGGIIQALAQDRDGLLWLGTQRGLFSYDGYQFRGFRTDPEQPNSLVGNYVRSLAFDTQGRLWIGTLNNGLSIYDPLAQTFSNYSYNPDDPNGISNDRVDALAADALGGMWVGSNAGLDYFDPQLGHFRHFPHVAGDPNSPNDDRIRSLLIDAQGDLWVGSWDGLNRRGANQSRFENVADNAAAGSIQGKNILRLYQDSGGAIWFGTPENGAGSLDPQSLRVDWLPITVAGNKVGSDLSGLSHPWVTGIAQSSDDELWIATYGGGINLIDPNSKKIKGHLRHDPTLGSSLGSDEIAPLLLGRSGLLWVGTWGAGLQYYNTRNLAFRQLHKSSVRSGGLSFADVTSLMQANDGLVWVGTSGNGIDLLDLQHGVTGGYRADKSDPDALVDDAVTALAQSADGTVWVGTRQSGLLRHRPGSAGFARYDRDDGLLNNYVHRILTTPGGELWIGTSGGLNRFDPVNNLFATVATLEHSDVPFEEQIDALSWDLYGNLWVGAESGLFLLKKDTSALQRIAHDPHAPNSLSDNDVNSLLLDRKGQLWISTSAGLDLLTDWDDAQARFESITARIGIPGKGLGTNLLEDQQGRIWTDHSNMIDPATWTLHEFSRVDGFDLGTAWIRSYAQLADGRLLYGGSKGLLLIDPEKLRLWDYDPPLVISEISVDSVMHRPASTIELAPGTRSFSVGFAALDYSNPKLNRYAFRLDPYDHDWISASPDRRIATYTNLDPGDYQLRIRGSNRLGAWGSQPLTIDIHQQAAWQQSTSFKLLLAITLMVSLYLLYRLRMHQLNTRQQVLERMVQARTAELEQALIQVERASLSDPLTGLRNRRYVYENIAGDVEQSIRINSDSVTAECADLVFYLIDIDHFKAVNDRYGHSAGDAVLVQFAQNLRTSFRQSDILVRWGGEEFLVISRFVDRANAAELAERLRQLVEAQPFDLGDERRIYKTCSIGFASFPLLPSAPSVGSWEQVVDLADMALYAAKRSRRNAWVGLSAGAKLADSTHPQGDIDNLLQQPTAIVQQSFQVQSSISEPDAIVW